MARGVSIQNTAKRIMMPVASAMTTLSDAELRAMSKLSMTASETNCWWVVFQCARTLQGLARMERERRRLVRSRQRRKAKETQT